MKKNYILSLLLLACYSFSFAKEVPVGSAKTVGLHYLQQHGELSLRNENDLKLVYTSGSSPACFYVFSSDHSFVMVSADDAVIPVLGYSKDRSFPQNVPSTVKGFFENYNKQVQYVVANHVAASPEIATDWSNLVANKSNGALNRTTSVAPLLSTTWSQSPYYNADCPYDAAGGGLSVTGCVATAMAQVMKFWNWPAHGAGLHSYSTASYGTLSANFGGTNYNWGAMPNNVSSPNAAVAELMYHIGVSVDMDYSAASSGAYVITSMSPVTNCTEYALRTYFDYKPSLHGVERAFYSDATWLNMIEGELNAGRPVVYAGYGTGGGHCFVADGFDASHNFHINWGWGGAGPDGYFQMDALNPPALGTGGGAGGFNNDQHAVIGIQPNGTASSASLEMYDYLTLTTSYIPYSDSFTAVCNVMNTSASAFMGDICYAAFDATTGNFTCILDSFMAINLPAGYVFGAPFLRIYTPGQISMLPGTYDIRCMYRNTGGSWITVNSTPMYVNSASITVYNNNFIELFTPVASIPTTLVQGAAASFSYQVYNNDPGYTWTDSLYLGIYNTNGTGNSDIGYIAGTTLTPSTASGTLTFNTASITATPGTYLLAAFFKYAGGWYLCGADFAQNPVYVTVVAPPPPPDIYEVNNTAGTAYDLSSTLTWVSNIASTSTPGSTLHQTSDVDYFKVVLPPGYHYTLSARVNDAVNKDDAGTYTTDVLWSYSTNGGSTWSATYNNTMSGNISLPGTMGGTVIFKVAPALAGNIGSYLFKIGNITRAIPTNIPDPALDAVRIFPNPATDVISIDFAGTNIHATDVTLTDMQGKKVYMADVSNQPLVTVPVKALAAGVYFVTVTTDAGTINRKITVTK